MEELTEKYDKSEVYPRDYNSDPPLKHKFTEGKFFKQENVQKPQVEQEEARHSKKELFKAQNTKQQQKEISQVYGSLFLLQYNVPSLSALSQVNYPFSV